jgi:HEAT repeat protein/Flp pilus assembly protein TadD
LCQEVEALCADRSRDSAKRRVFPCLAAIALLWPSLAAMSLGCSPRERKQDDNPASQAPSENITVPPEVSRRISELIGLLRSDDPETRRTAGTELLRLGRAAFDRLALATRNADSDLRRESAKVISGVKDQRVPAVLGALLNDEDWAVREAAAEGLGSCGEAKTPALLVPLLGDDFWRVRSAALRALAGLKASSCVAQIAALCNDPDEDVRYEAVKTLCAIGTEQCRDPLDLVSDPDPEIARAAFAAQPWPAERLEESRKVSIAAIADLASEDVAKRTAARDFLSGSTAFAAEVIDFATRNKAHLNTALDVIETMGPEAAAQALSKFLKSEDVDFRTAGLRVLGPAAASALPALLKDADDDPDQAFRCMAAGILSRSDPDSAADILRKLARDPAQEVRVIAIHGLARLENGPDLAWIQETLAAEQDAACRLAMVNLMLRQPLELSAPVLKALIKDGDPEIRRNIILTMAQQNGTSFFDVFADALSDPADGVRQSAIAALARVGDKSRAAELIRMLITDTSASVRKEAVRALSYIAAEEAIGPLVDALARDPDTNVRHEILRCLPGFDSEAARTAIVKAALGTDEMLAFSAIELLTNTQGPGATEAIRTVLRDGRTPVLRSAAARALGMSKREGAEEELIAALEFEREPVPRASIALALGMRGGEKSVEPLRALLKDSDSQVRYSAITALGAIRAAGAIDDIAACLDDTSAIVRLEAVRFAGRFGARKASGKLAARLADEDPRVRSEAITALAKTNDDSLEPLLRESAFRLFSDGPADEAHVRTGLWLFARGLRKMALAELSEVVRVSADGSPAWVEAKRVIVKLRLEAGEFARAASEMDEIIVSLRRSRLDPAMLSESEVTLHYALALTYFSKRRERKALAEMDSALGKTHNDAERADTLNNVAWYLCENGLDPERAVEYARQAAALSPDSSDILDTLGAACLKTGRIEEAEANLGRASSMNPEVPWFSYRYAMSLALLGKTDKALTALANAVYADPSFAERAAAAPEFASIKDNEDFRRIVAGIVEWGR